jgi:type IV secretion system protein VirD4
MKIIEQLVVLVFQLIETLFKFVFEMLEKLYYDIPGRNKVYNASFVSERDILSIRNKGFCLTGRRCMSVKDSYQNALIIGGTGTGKSSIVLIPSLYQMESSFIVHDPSGELHSKTSGALSENDVAVRVLNFANPSVSVGYNPLSRIQTTSDVQKIASMLVESAFGGKGKDPFWNSQAVALIAILIGVLRKVEDKYLNLYNVRQLLNMLGGDPEAVDGLFSRVADDQLFGEYKAFLAYDEKVVNGVIATAKAALNIFSDPAVASVTAFDDLDFEEFRNKRVALFIQNSVADQKYYSVLTSIFFEQLFAYILSRFPGKNENDIFLLIDEASSLNLPTLPLAVANVRKHRAGIMLLLQDYNQLIHQYGRHDAESIRSNCFAKMYFTGQSLETSKDLESILGKFEFVDEKENKVVRPLMTNDEIRTMKADRALIICGNQLPVMAKLRPYYKNRRFRELSEIPPLVHQGILVERPLFKINSYEPGYTSHEAE